MFEILPNPPLEMVWMAARAVLLGGAFWVFALAFARWRRADERQADELQLRFEQAFIELRSLHETVTVMNARIEALGERAETQARLAPTGTVSAQRGYDLAARMAKNGATAEALVASCGITRHEAELLARLHAAKACAAQAPAFLDQRSFDRADAAAIGSDPAQHSAWRAAPGAAGREADHAQHCRKPEENPRPDQRGGDRRRGSLLSIVG